MEHAVKSYENELDLLRSLTLSLGKLTGEQLADISTRSVEVLATMTGIEWVHSYVTTDRIYCVYFAENESLVLERYLPPDLATRVQSAENATLLTRPVWP